MRMRMYTVHVGLLVGVVSCRSNPPDATADPAILRGALQDWQEGLTDGRVCLDSRVLPSDSTHSGAPPQRWADSVVAPLMSDTRIALDSTTGTPIRPNSRLCAPTREHPRVS